MTTKTIAAEEYLCQLQLEILRLREVVSGLYRAGEDRQHDVFYRYENLLNHKCAEYLELVEALEQAENQ